MRAGLNVRARRGDLVARLTVDPELRANPFEAYEVLREDGPIIRTPVLSATVSHAHVNHMLRSDSFGTAAGRAGLPGPARRLMDRWQDPQALGPVDPPSLLVTDAPDHTRMRKQVAKAFSARSVSAMEDRVHSVTERLLDGLAKESRFDLVDRFAAQLPLAVIADLLGVRDEDRADLLRRGNEAAVLLDPGLSWSQFKRSREAVRAMNAWIEFHVRQLRQNPGDDLLSRLAVMGELDDTELKGVGLLVLGAGFETTVSLISNAVTLFDQHPDQREAAEADWGNAVEEVLRYDSPVQVTVREAYADTEVEGTPIRKGEAVLLFLGGANRDPAVFENPQDFDVTRPNAHDHLAFSAGAHFCIGASLARLEGAVGLGMLYERFPDLALAGRPTRRNTRVLRGYDRVPVSHGPARVRQSAPAQPAGR